MRPEHSRATEICFGFPKAVPKTFDWDPVRLLIQHRRARSPLSLVALTFLRATAVSECAIA